MAKTGNREFWCQEVLNETCIRIVIYCEISENGRHPINVGKGKKAIHRQKSIRSKGHIPIALWHWCYQYENRTFFQFLFFVQCSSCLIIYMK